MAQVAIRAPVDNRTGYAVHLAQLVRGLEIRGHKVTIRPIKLWHQFKIGAPSALADRFVMGEQRPQWEFILAHPFEIPSEGKRTFYYTMWETDVLPPRALIGLNRCEAVAVPCRWNKEVLERSGVTVPIHVIPLGFDPTIFKYTEPKPKPICVFGTAGFTAHGRKRKGLDRVVRAFMASFPGVDDVLLKVKCSLKCDVDMPDDRRVQFDRTDMTDEGIADWLAQCNAYISGATAEAFGFWQLQSLAVGRPIAAVPFGGLNEYFDPIHGYPLQSFTDQAEQFYYDGVGQWQAPELHGLVSAMMSIYLDRGLAQRLGKEAAESVRKMTWDAHMATLVDLFKSLGILADEPRPVPKVQEIPRPMAVRPEGYRAKAGFDSRPQPYPSVTKQGRFRAHFFKMPTEPRIMNFNCGLMELDGQKWLATRKARYISKGRLDSSIFFWKIKPDMTITDGVRPGIPKEDVCQQFEDPRVFLHQGMIYVSCVTWASPKALLGHQLLVILDRQFNFQSQIDLQYGGNGPDLWKNTAIEKNWTWFVHEERLHVVYYIAPKHMVICVDNRAIIQEHITEFPAGIWAYDPPRGGTPPLRVGDEYFAFFHSSLPYHIERRRYFMGAYAFEAKPPFRVTRVTREPILVGSEDDPRVYEGPCVVFPCGSLLSNGEWLVTLGVNDEKSAFIRIPHNQLLEIMT